MRLIVAFVAGLLAIAACGAGPTPSPTPSPSPGPTVLPSPTTSPSPTTPLPSPTGSPSPTPTPSVAPSPTPTPVSGELSPAQVRYLLIDQLGPLHYCDPDEYPISHGDEQQKALAQFAIIQADSETFAAITERIGIAGQTEFSDADKLAIYREWKQLNSVDAQPLGNSMYQFDVTTEGDAASGQALHILGTVDAASAEIAIASQEQVFGTSCPICLARGTLIATPTGLRPVEQLQPGDPIWTVDAAGRRTASTVERIGSVPVPSSHQVVHVVLADGRSLYVSPGHPLTDGRHAGDLVAGDMLDGATVVSADLTDYDGGRTFDILPAGDTGFYWANGILLASTLR